MNAEKIGQSPLATAMDFPILLTYIDDVENRARFLTGPGPPRESQILTIGAVEVFGVVWNHLEQAPRLLFVPS